MGLFQECTALWTAGCWLARRLHQLKASITLELGISIFLIFVRCVALRNSDLLNFTQAPILVWFDDTIIVQVHSQYFPLNYVLQLTVFMFCYEGWLCMVINISVQYDGGFLPDIMLLTPGYYHWGTQLNTT